MGAWAAHGDNELKHKGKRVWLPGPRCCLMGRRAGTSSQRTLHCARHYPERLGLEAPLFQSARVTLGRLLNLFDPQSPLRPSLL